MSDLVLQTIAEKLQRLEEQILRHDDTPKPEPMPDILTQQFQSLQTDMKLLLNKHDISQDNLAELLYKVELINKPVKTKVEHKHRLHKGIWVAIVCLVVAVLLMIAWINSIHSRAQYEANDMKYRSLKVFGGREILKVLYQTDSIYSRDKDLFVERVRKKEQRLAEQANLLLLADEKEKEAKELKKKAGNK